MLAQLSFPFSVRPEAFVLLGVNLDRIADLVGDYDIVALQEVDCGSLRSGFLNQAKYLAELGRFPFVFNQSNRRIGLISQHSNALLSRYQPDRVEDLKLPGFIRGRGVLWASFGDSPDALQVFIVHLALGKPGRMRQMAFLAELIQPYPHVIIMGDLNCRSRSMEMRWLLGRTQMCEPQVAFALRTFPSWRPKRQLDHILISSSIEVENVEVLPHTFSDHLPIAMQIALPRPVHRAA